MRNATQTTNQSNLTVLKVCKGSLWAVVPGREDDEFQLLSKNVFTVKGKQGYTITFQMKSDKPKGFTSVQPNGTFKAVFNNRYLSTHINLVSKNIMCTEKNHFLN